MIHTRCTVCGLSTSEHIGGCPPVNRVRDLTDLVLRHELSLGGHAEHRAELARREREGYPEERRCDGCGYKTAARGLCSECRERLKAGRGLRLAWKSEGLRAMEDDRCTS